MNYIFWGIIILITIFIITREFWCWYLKINKRIELMEEQNNLLKELIGSGKISGNEDMIVLNKPLWKK